MSFKALAEIRGVEAPGASALLLLFILAEYAGADGLCFPSQCTLSERSRLSVRAVRDNLAALEGAGLIERDRRTRKDGTRSSDRIRLTYYVPEQPAESASCEDINRQNDVEDNRRQTARQPAAVAGLTTFEPVSESITSPRKREVAVDFEKWWEVYPRKAEKAGALKLFERIVRTRAATSDELIAAAQRYAIQTHGRDLAMVKNPTTWLQRECWKPDGERASTEGAAASTPLGFTRPEFAGPARVRALVVSERGEAWARSWLDPCGWDEAASQIIPRSALAADRIRQELRRQLHDAGITVGDVSKEPSK